MYKSINLNSTEINIYSTPNGEKELKNLSQINIFIGPNNTGKSKFLRGLFSNDNPEFTIGGIDLSEVNSAITTLRNLIDDYFKRNRITNASGVDLNKLNDINFLSRSVQLKTGFYDAVVKLSNLTITTMSGGSSGLDMRTISNTIRVWATDCLSRLDSIKSLDNSKIQHDGIYIPTLRGLRGIDFGVNNGLGDKDNYLTRTVIDYFKADSKIRDSIYTGLSLYEDLKKQILGSSKEREQFEFFIEFISKSFFDGQKFSITPNIKDNVVHVKIGDDDEYPVYKLGDGIQSIIILTYPLFFNIGKNMNVYYEEPDMFLHPGFQRIFLETLLRPEFETFQFYIATHSNHFLDMTLDFNSISVYSFHKIEKGFTIDNVKNDDKNILEILGVKNSSVFLSNCTIWVEGITDRIYIRKYIELYNIKFSKGFKEDIHYSFVEYGGANITHWSFLDDSDPAHPNIEVKNLCAKLFLITDRDGTELNSDGSKPKKLLRQEHLQATLGEQYYCLESREIENILTPETIINIIKDFEENDCAGKDFSKIISSSYKNLYLGKYIDDNVSDLSRAYANKSGTVKDKVEFAKRAVKYMSDYDSLSDEAKALTEGVYNFIKKNNP